MARTGTQQHRSAAEVCQHVELGDDAQKLLNPRQTPREFLSMLREHKLYSDALRFVAHALTIQEALWWGSLCIWEMSRPEPSAKIAAALRAIVGWLQNPSETTRRAAEAAAKGVGTNQAVGMLALAVFFSGGSISKPKLPAVEPKSGLAANTVAAAVLLASKQSESKLVAQRQRQFLAFADEVMAGRSRWLPE